MSLTKVSGNFIYFRERMSVRMICLSEHGKRKFCNKRAKCRFTTIIKKEYLYPRLISLIIVINEGIRYRTSGTSNDEKPIFRSVHNKSKFNTTVTNILLDVYLNHYYRGMKISRRRKYHENSSILIEKLNPLFAMKILRWLAKVFKQFPYKWKKYIAVGNFIDIVTVRLSWQCWSYLKPIRKFI